MSLSVAFVGTDRAAQAAWDHYVAGHPDSTVYHRREWQTIFGEGLGYQGFLLLARTNEGRTRGVLPLYLVPSLWRRRLVAVPFRDRGGPVWDDQAALDALLRSAARLARDYSADLVLKSLQPLPPGTDLQALERLDHWIRSALELDEARMESIWDRIGPKRRNMVRRAESHGVEIECVAGSAAAAERWYGLHLSTQRRLGLPPFPARFFRSMLEHLGKEGSAEIMEAHRAGRTCAAALLLFHRDTCIYGYSASTEEGQGLRANDLIVYRAIQRTLQRSMRIFDFGSDSPLQRNLLFFKSSWGAAQSAVASYATRGRGSINDSSRRRYAFARAVVQRLPPTLLAAVGERVTRYLG